MANRPGRPPTRTIRSTPARRSKSNINRPIGPSPKTKAEDLSCNRKRRIARTDTASGSINDEFMALAETLGNDYYDHAS